MSAIIPRTCSKIRVPIYHLYILYTPSTPYCGLLIELGMKPIEYIIHFKIIMLYHNIINTKTEKLSKDIIEQQMITNKGSII